MLVEEDTKVVEVNPDALDEVFAEELVDDETSVFVEVDEEVDEIDIAFQANDEGYW